MPLTCSRIGSGGAGFGGGAGAATGVGALDAFAALAAGGVEFFADVDGVSTCGYSTTALSAEDADCGSGVLTCVVVVGVAGAGGREACSTLSVFGAGAATGVLAAAESVFFTVSASDFFAAAGPGFFALSGSGFGASPVTVMETT